MLKEFWTGLKAGASYRSPAGKVKGRALARPLSGVERRGVELGQRIAGVYQNPTGKLILNAAAIGAPVIGVGMMLSGNGNQEPNLSDMPPPTNLGTGVVDPSLVVSTLGHMPDEKAVERELTRLRNQQVYNGLTIQALEYAERNRQFLDQARMARGMTPLAPPATSPIGDPLANNAETVMMNHGYPVY